MKKANFGKLIHKFLEEIEKRLNEMLSFKRRVLIPQPIRVPLVIRKRSLK